MIVTSPVHSRSGKSDNVGEAVNEGKEKNVMDKESKKSKKKKVPSRNYLGLYRTNYNLVAVL